MKKFSLHTSGSAVVELVKMLDSKTPFLVKGATVYLLHDLYQTFHEMKIDAVEYIRDERCVEQEHIYSEYMPRVSGKIPTHHLYVLPGKKDELLSKLEAYLLL